jgi:hypothetical protein
LQISHGVCAEITVDKAIYGKIKSELDQRAADSNPARETNEKAG